MSLQQRLCQTRRAADPPRLVLHAAARRKLLDRGPLSADSPAHRAAGVAPDVIGREQPRVARRATAGVSAGNDGLRGRASPKTGLVTVMPQERAVSPEQKPRNGGRQAAVPSPAHGVETRIAPNRKSGLLCPRSHLSDARHRHLWPGSARVEWRDVQRDHPNLRAEYRIPGHLLSDHRHGERRRYQCWWRLDAGVPGIQQLFRVAQPARRRLQVHLHRSGAVDRQGGAERVLPVPRGWTEQQRLLSIAAVEYLGPMPVA
jgi:hypothetical protein